MDAFDSLEILQMEIYLSQRRSGCITQYSIHPSSHPVNSTCNLLKSLRNEWSIKFNSLLTLQVRRVTKATVTTVEEVKAQRVNLKWI